MDRAIAQDGEILSQLRLEIDRSIENPSRIHIKVKEAVVMLTGDTDHFLDQVACEDMAKRIPGVVAVVQNIQLNLPSHVKDRDAEIARKCKMAIESDPAPCRSLKVVVKDGCVILKGEVRSVEQRQEAESAICKIPEIKMIQNDTVIVHGLKAVDICAEIQRAFKHVVEHHARAIEVELRDGKAILRGVARAWFEIVVAETVASEIPGVKEVINQIELTPLLKGREVPPERQRV